MIKFSFGVLVSLFLFFMYFFRNHYFFFFYMFLFCFFSIVNCSWNGLFFFFDSYNYVALMFMGLFVLGLILFSESKAVIIYLAQSLIVISALFFSSCNVMMFYVLFELSMFPILILIVGYGYQIEKINSFFYLVFYTTFCSMPFLFIYFMSDFSLNIVYFDMVLSWELIFILSMMFMMKFPVYFLHLWLPKAHVEAPTSASMLLAGLMLKLGTAGFLRIMKALSICHLNYWFIVCFLGMILAAFNCIFQSDVKSLAAYSSICHMSFVMLSMLFVTMSGKTSSLLMMVAHGYTSTLLFYIIGNFYSVTSTRMVYYFNSFFRSNTLITILFSFCLLSNMGLPISLSFMSEFFTITNMFILFNHMFVVLFVYFFVAFYYSIYTLVNTFLGGSFIDFTVMSFYSVVSLTVMCYNVFWFNLLF